MPSVVALQLKSWLASRLLLLPLLALALAACGGSGGGAPEPEPPVNRAPEASAGADQTVRVGTAVTLDGRASHDPDGDPLQFTWRITASPAGSQAALNDPALPQPVFTPDFAGAYTVSLVVSDGRLSSTPATTTVVAESLVAPQIEIGQDEPVGGVVVFTLSGDYDGAVSWYVNLQLLGISPAGTPAMMSWNTTGAANGEQLVVARIQDGQGGVVELRRNFQVFNNPVSLSASVSGTSGNIRVNITATSPNGIRSVSATLDDQPLGTLTEPNGCLANASPPCNPARGYEFHIDAAAIGSGKHVVHITAVDNAGHERSLSVDLPVANLPVLELVQPLDGAIVHGTLAVTGRVSSDRPGAVQVTAQLDSLPVTLDMVDGQFSSTLNLDGVTPGQYVLTVRAVDAFGTEVTLSRRIAVAPSAALAYKPVIVLEATVLAAVNGPKALVRSGYGPRLVPLRLHDMASGEAVVLDESLDGYKVDRLRDWAIADDGRVHASGDVGDCAGSCVYQWTAGGQRVNISAANPHAALEGGAAYPHTDNALVVRGNYLLWHTTTRTSPSSQWLILYDAVQHRYKKIEAPVGLNPGNIGLDMAVHAGVVHVYFWAMPSGSGSSTTYDVYEWRSDTQSVQRVTDGAGRHTYVHTDGERVAWESRALSSGCCGPFRIQSAPTASLSPVETVTESATWMQLDQGVLLWREPPGPSGTAIFGASTADGTVHTLSAFTNTQPRGAGEGVVGLFWDDGMFYTWDGRRNERTLRFSGVPEHDRVFISGGHLVFVYRRLVYRVPLD